MAKAKTDVDALPEVSVETGAIVDRAKEAVDFRTTEAQAAANGKLVREKIEVEASALRKEYAETNEFIGLIRVAGDDAPPVRVEFRFGSGGKLPLTEENKIDGLFGPSRPILFSKEKTITAIKDPAQLVADLKQKGRNPWDFLTVIVRSGCEGVVCECSDAVIAGECFLPRKGFLARIKEMVGEFSDETVSWLKTYLDKALSPTVVVGSKGVK